MERMIRAMIDALNRGGFRAVAAVPMEKLPMLKKPLVTVEAERAVCADGGMYRYLGIYNGRELYGRRLEAVLRLEVFVPEKAGPGREVLWQVVQLLLDGVPTLSVGDLTVEESRFQPAADCFAGTLKVPVKAFCYATVSDDGTEFVDFKLKGELK